VQRAGPGPSGTSPRREAPRRRDRRRHETLPGDPLGSSATPTLVQWRRSAPRLIFRAMSLLVTSIERAFTLARTGEYAGSGEIRRQLKAEGFDTTQLSGPTLLKQIRDLCTEARRNAKGS